MTQNVFSCKNTSPEGMEFSGNEVTMWVLLMLGCAGFDPQAWIDQAQEQVDHDGDTVTVKEGDCDDTCDEMGSVPGEQDVCLGWFVHPGVEAGDPRPGGPEVDHDCNGVVDGQEPGADFDRDGYSPVPVTEGDAGDCNDLDSRMHGEHEECCGDLLDNDCDGRVDEAACVNATAGCPLLVGGAA